MCPLGLAIALLKNRLSLGSADGEESERAHGGVEGGTSGGVTQDDGSVEMGDDGNNMGRAISSILSFLK